MLPRGKVGLIYVALGRETGILTDEVYAALVIVIATTTFLGPLLLKAHYATRRTRELEP